MEPVNSFSFDKEASGDGFCDREKDTEELLTVCGGYCPFSIDRP